MNRHSFFNQKCFLVISRLMIVLFHPDPATNRNSAILVVQFSDCTATQESTGGLAVLAFFPDRIAFSATTDPPDTQASPPMQGCLCSAQE